MVSYKGMWNKLKDNEGYRTAISYMDSDGESKLSELMDKIEKSQGAS